MSPANRDVPLEDGREALVRGVRDMSYAITRSYVQDFGNVRLAVVERQTGPKSIKTSTEILQGEATEDTWRRLEAVLNETNNWLEAS